MANAKPASAVVRTAAKDRDLRMLLVDLAAGRACEHIAGEFLGLSGSDEQKTDQKSTEKAPAKAKRGRLWIERCKAERHEGDQVEFELVGRGWRWVDKKSEKLGAKFEVSQYVRFDAKIQATTTVDLSYARTKRVLTVMVNATKPVKAKVSPLGEIDADAKGAWSSLLGAASTVIGKSPDKEASKKFASQGSQNMAQQLARGWTVAFDMCSGQKYETLGDLADGALPDVALEPRGRLWKENERVELMPSGVDLSGPYKQEQMPFSFELKVEEGEGVLAQVLCVTEARKVAEAFIGGKKLPEVPVLASDVVQTGKIKTLRVEKSSCDVVLYTRPAGKTALFSYLAFPEGATQRALVPCEGR